MRDHAEVIGAGAVIRQGRKDLTLIRMTPDLVYDIAVRDDVRLDFRAFAFGKGVETARSVIRRHVPHLDVDRPLNADHNTMKALVQSAEILEAVEKAVGPLG